MKPIIDIDIARFEKRHISPASDDFECHSLRLSAPLRGSGWSVESNALDQWARYKSAKCFERNKDNLDYVLAFGGTQRTFVKCFKNETWPKRHFLYSSRRVQDSGVMIAKSGKFSHSKDKLELVVTSAMAKEVEYLLDPLDVVRGLSEVMDSVRFFVHPDSPLEEFIADVQFCVGHSVVMDFVFESFERSLADPRVEQALKQAVSSGFVRLIQIPFDSDKTYSDILSKVPTLWLTCQQNANFYFSETRLLEKGPSFLGFEAIGNTISRFVINHAVFRRVKDLTLVGFDDSALSDVVGNSSLKRLCLVETRVGDFSTRSVTLIAEDVVMTRTFHLCPALPRTNRALPHSRDDFEEYLEDHVLGSEAIKLNDGYIAENRRAFDVLAETETDDTVSEYAIFNLPVCKRYFTTQPSLFRGRDGRAKGPDLVFIDLRRARRGDTTWNVRSNIDFVLLGDPLAFKTTRILVSNRRATSLCMMQASLENSGQWTFSTQDLWKVQYENRDLCWKRSMGFSCSREHVDLTFHRIAMMHILQVNDDWKGDVEKGYIPFTDAVTTFYFAHADVESSTDPIVLSPGNIVAFIAAMTMAECIRSHLDHVVKDKTSMDYFARQLGQKVHKAPTEWVYLASFYSALAPGSGVGRPLMDRFLKDAPSHFPGTKGVCLYTILPNIGLYRGLGFKEENRFFLPESKPPMQVVSFTKTFNEQ